MPKPISSELVATQLAASFARQGVLMAWQARLASAADGACEIVLPMSAVVTQQHGFFHGGVIGTLADAAGGYAANTLLMPSHECLSAEYKINFVAPGIGDTLIARGKVLKAGKTLVVSSAEVFVVKDGVEKLCAIMQQTLFVIPIN
ncbi:MAG: PaaI family thioesterase [Glaciimonas sp.]|nr:PaaI family thioesterase [Glaciimonas sp.]